MRVQKGDEKQTFHLVSFFLARVNRGEEEKRENKRKKRKKKREKGKKVCFCIGNMHNLGFWYEF